MRKDELMNKALEMLENDDELFVGMVNELDSWNGFADGFRCYPMDELDDLFYGCSLTEFLDKLTGDFNIRDNYFVDTIYGLESTDYVEDVYRDNVRESYLLEEIIDESDHIYINDSDFEEIIEQIKELDEEELEAA